jgi:hypothetical protein
MRRILIALDAMNPPGVTKEVDDYLSSQGWTVWHWLEHVWVVLGPPDTQSAEELWSLIELWCGPEHRPDGLAVDLDPPGVVGHGFEAADARSLSPAWGNPTRLAAGGAR